MVFPRKRQNGRSGPSLSDFQEGTLIKIRENGTPVDFYVAKHDYESQLNGAGRTLLVRKDAWQQSVWNSSGVNEYANGTLDNFLRFEYVAVLPENVLSILQGTTFYYTIGNRNNRVSQLTRAVFCLSLTELGYSGSDFNVEGSPLPISSVLDASFENWTRTPSTGAAWPAYRQNAPTAGQDYSIAGVGYATNTRPCFTLPSTTPIDPDTMEVIA